MQGGKHSAAAYSELEKWMYGSIVANAASFVVSAGTGMNLNISTGAGLISDTIARRIGTDAVETATVPTASASFNRIDTVVAYIDTSVTPTTSVTDNTNDILKFVVVAGTAASTPVAPTGAAIISAIGAGKPYMVLYDALVPQNATNTSGMTFTDRRVLPSASAIADAIVTAVKLATNAVTTVKILDGAVTTAKLSAAAGDIAGAWQTYTPVWTGSTSNPSIGNGSIAGRYQRIGKTVKAQIQVAVGSTTTYGSGQFRWSLPVAPKSGVKFVGSGWALRSGSAFYPFPVSNIDIFGIAQAYIAIVNAGGGLTNGTAAWGNGDFFALQIEYEVD